MVTNQLKPVYNYLSQNLNQTLAISVPISYYLVKLLIMDLRPMGLDYFEIAKLRSAFSVQSWGWDCNPTNSNPLKRSWIPNLAGCPRIISATSK